MKKTRVTFRNFVNAPEKRKEIYSKLRHVFTQVIETSALVFVLHPRRCLDDELRDVGELEQLLI
jgi:hypothetical protein